MTKALLTITIVLSLTALANAGDILPSNAKSCVSLKHRPGSSGFAKVSASNSCNVYINVKVYHYFFRKKMTSNMFVEPYGSSISVDYDADSDVQFCAEYVSESVRKRAGDGVCP